MFGISIRNGSPVLTAPPEKLKIEDLCQQELPFYSDGVSYKVPDQNNGMTALKLELFGGVQHREGRQRAWLFRLMRRW